MRTLILSHYLLMLGVRSTKWVFKALKPVRLMFIWLLRRLRATSSGASGRLCTWGWVSSCGIWGIRQKYTNGLLRIINSRSSHSPLLVITKYVSYLKKICLMLVFTLKKKHVVYLKLLPAKSNIMRQQSRKVHFSLSSSTTYPRLHMQNNEALSTAGKTSPGT